MTEQIQSAPPVCKKCGCEKTWGKNRSKKTGGAWICRPCSRENSSSWRNQNPGKALALVQGWRASNPELQKATAHQHYLNNKSTYQANSNRWKNQNPEKTKDIQSRWQKNNPEKAASSQKAWRENNPESEVLRTQKRRARKVNAIVPGRPVTAAIESERKALFDGCCYCGAQKKLTLEHVVALDAGGLHVEENLLGACLSCNSSKNNRPVEQWFRAQEFFSEKRWQQIQQALEG